MGEIPARCDVVVIGGGPAGSMAGTFLNQRGYDVVLVDKARHPRYQVGESVIPHFWKFTDLAKASAKIETEGFVRKAGGTAVWNGVIRQMAFKDFGYTRPALHVERDRFDWILLDHARSQGVRVFEEATASRVTLDRSGLVSVGCITAGDRTERDVACRFAVDASGQSAVIAKQLGIRVIDQAFRFMSVWGYFTGSKYVASDGRAHPFNDLPTVPPTTFVSSVDDWGWLWHIPLRESTSVGLVLPVQQIKALKGDDGLETYFLRKCHEIPYLDRLLEDARYCEGSLHAIRDYSYLPTELAGPGFFLIGDAAAFVDPIFSVGISLAMYSAYMCAWAIDRSLRVPALAEKTRTIFARQLRKRLELSRSLALPRYGVGSSASDLARDSMRFERGLEQELMYVASTLTTRNENFVDVAQDRDGHMITSEKFRILEDILF